MVTIRPETDDDTAEVAALHVRAWQWGYAGIVPAELLDTLSAPAWARQRRDRRAAAGADAFLTLVAADGPAVVGFTSIGPYRHHQDRAHLDPGVGELLAIYLEPARVGTGLGRELMDAAMAELARRGYRTVRLWVLEENDRARRFYEKAGFTTDGERSDYKMALPSGGEPVLLPEVRYVTTIGGAG
jgi:ribosomal protein S18 acetylase RimI-like enzyme